MTFLRVALTGGIATGKSYVLARFAARQIPTIDADFLARDVVRPGEQASHAIRLRFGPDVFAADGQLDRPRLARRVFDDPQERAALEAIVHPAVRAAIDRWFAKVASKGSSPFGVADIPLLFETGRQREFDRVVVTACAEPLQLERLMTRDGLSEADARKRMGAQLPTPTKVAEADFTIRTDESFEATNHQVDAVYDALNRESARGR